ncbi:MAG: DinB family protein [Lewinellaceae bacterium]|nr:DinB family protein [Lewinellaceae bacterium]
MLKENLLEFFERDLLKLKEEIGLYPEESAIWEIRPGISNSAGNLCLHLVGNLNHFIGAVLGNTGYIRQRDEEFSLKNIPRTELLLSVDQTILVLKTTLQGFSESDFDKIYPLEKHGKVVTTRYMILHLLTHLNYHLGQLTKDYSRGFVLGLLMGM